MARRLPPQLCAKCKGYKKLCGLPTCPILERFRVHARIATDALRGGVNGATPPSVIVGEAGYPNVPLLYHIPPGKRGRQAEYHDAPQLWAEKKESLRRIVLLRSSMIAAAERHNALKPEDLYSREISVAAISAKPVDTEAVLEKRPVPSLRFDGMLAPLPPSAPAKELKISSNPVPPKPLEKRIWDDAPSAETVEELYRDGVSIYTIISAMSLGMIGRLRSRRLVPTRWAITAVDSIISTRLLRKLRSRDIIDYYEVYYGSYLGNHFTVILLPHHYIAEMIEVWHPLTPWTRTARQPIIYHIHEYTSLRQSLLDGGYMAARLAIAEHLARRRRQAAVIILREITRDYYAPVGNWHIRETVRHALQAGPIYRGTSLEEAMQVAAKHARSRAAVNALHESRLLRRVRATRSLDHYLA